jgi:type II secretory pathway component GspD/PulD (secretin)
VNEAQGVLSSLNDVAIVADERINALVIYAGRADRRTIDELIEVLDSDDLVDSIVASTPRLVFVQNTRAARVLEILQNVYRAQLQSTGGGRQLRIPEGVSREVASILQQINAAANSPLLTLGIDEITNSLVIRAPLELAEEVERFVKTLDEQAAAQRARAIRIIPLERTKSTRVREALELMIERQ